MSRWVQVSGLFRREVARFCKVPLQTLGAPIINSFLYLLIFGVSLGSSIRLENGTPYLAFLIPGLIAMSVIKNVFDNTTSSIMGQKYVNELQDHKTTPLSIQQLCWARSFASLMRGLLVGLITYLVGQAFFFTSHGNFLTIYSPHMFLYFTIVGGLAFGFLGIAIGMWSKSFEHVGAVSMLVLLPLIYLGGVFFSLEHVHLFWQKVSHINPLYYIIYGIRYGFIGGTREYLALSAGVTLLFLLFCYILALRSLGRGRNFVR